MNVSDQLSSITELLVQDALMSMPVVLTAKVYSSFQCTTFDTNIVLIHLSWY